VYLSTLALNTRCMGSIQVLCVVCSIQPTLWIAEALSRQVSVILDIERYQRFRFLWSGKKGGDHTGRLSLLFVECTYKTWRVDEQHDTWVGELGGEGMRSGGAGDLRACACIIAAFFRTVIMIPLFHGSLVILHAVLQARSYSGAARAIESVMARQTWIR
jgi:hypothetical protein